jgi:hypothetical protein
MVCQICGRKSGFYPLCSECNKLKAKGEVSKCIECGLWKKGDKPLCHECWLKNQKVDEEKNADTKVNDEEKEFRTKFPATIRTEDGHFVRSKAEKIIDDWLYHEGIVHAYERRVPVDEPLYCDFFIPRGKVWVEFWGLTEEKYTRRKALKKSLYDKYDKSLIELTDKDIEKLDDVFPIKLRPHLPPTFSFD